MREVLRYAVNRLPPKVRFRGENVFVGFEKAYRLLPIDREMASFRAITAEEEAASALFRALHLRKYEGADELNLHDHRHKSALRPFLAAVQRAMFREHIFTLNLTLDGETPSIAIGIPLASFGVSIPGKEDLQLELAEPLGLTAELPGAKSVVEAIQNEFTSIATADEFATVKKYIDSEANKRNGLLYATNTALPTTQVTEASIKHREERAMLALYLCVAVLQVEKPQILGQDALTAFLNLVRKLPA
jgi:hypothetical protein